MQVSGVPNSTPPAGFEALLVDIADRANTSGVFGAVGVIAGVLSCEAKASSEPANYRVFYDPLARAMYVALQTEARWLSQSIEADLMHTGDVMEDLLLEELVELGYEGASVKVEHFRDEAKQYTFRSRVPVSHGALSTPAAAEITARFLLAYEACFRPLGDMETR